ncbi:MAG: hypothetical protein UU80_C0029G0009 [candidate division WWE3 bacterium GW2011_GWA1_41_8]|uniref:Uncharacterized protein n=3 Tax=Katanobacteria TaxID=422282 RepID=A0A0G0X8R9_UNCKA|nr:MAG: hypothetical protein UU72_C0042G0008 [candidate division WWE3 bacterium GW2011_GWB1_41_6]KKS21439.1 MAG: hypothetical protein UU80_C0029G0009 [candidate division WWE3 bacterium GW2011_GWA1_41_8]OGC56745.1 MAG: hypothetical protein A2976_03555 [candidate division WWE3 bacterium RIFCSPLOWO2_01_FULL_41_9]
MIERLKAPISIFSFYDHKRKLFTPLVVIWEGRKYKVSKIGYHHTYRSGRVLHHVFSVATKNLYFRLVCNTENFFWEVEEISDGAVN